MKQNVNKVQLKMSDPGKLGFTPKRNLEPLSKEELKNLQFGDDILIYRQATDQVYQVKVIKITLDPSMFWVTNDRIQSKFDMETGISLSKEWVACKPVETKVKAYTKLMSYEKLGKIINSKMHDQQLYTVCKDDFINKTIQLKLPTDYQKLSKKQFYQILEPHFRFIRDDKNHPYATVCTLTIITPSQRIDRATGIAICAPKDQFNRQIGKQLAYDRARTALTTKQNSLPLGRDESERVYELMSYDYDYKSSYQEGI